VYGEESGAVIPDSVR